MLLANKKAGTPRFTQKLKGTRQRQARERRSRLRHTATARRVPDVIKKRGKKNVKNPLRRHSVISRPTVPCFAGGRVNEPRRAVVARSLNAL